MTQVREPPDVTKSHTEAHRGEQVLDFVVPFGPDPILLFSIFSKTTQQGIGSSSLVLGRTIFMVSVELIQSTHPNFFAGCFIGRWEILSVPQLELENEH